jgi:hypothetical protein
MIDTIGQFYYYLVNIFTILNPFIVFVCTILWVSIYFETRKEVNRSYIRNYVLQKKINDLLDKSDIDPEYIKILKKMGLSQE